MNKLTHFLFFILSGLISATALAEAEYATATYDLTIAGFRIATIEDCIRTNGDSYKIESSIFASGLLSWLGLVPILRQSEGTIDTSTQMLHISKYTYETRRDQLSIGVDRLSGTINHDYKGRITQVDIPSETVNFALHDSLTFAYSFFVLGDNRAKHLSYLYLDGKRTRIHEWVRLDSYQVIVFDGKEYNAVRYNKMKRGEHKGSIWFVPEFRMLPGLVSIEVGHRVVIKAMLVDFTFSSTT